MTIRLLIVTGYLGAGKTTLLKNLRYSLDNDVTCRFIVNEAGEVALDQAVYTLGADNTVVLAGGCACCVRRDALVATLREAVDSMDRAKPGWIVVETSWLANPAPIVFSILGDDLLKHHIAIAGVVTAVGAEEGEAALARYPEAEQQLAMADAVVLTKTDRVDATTRQRLTTTLAARTARVPVYVTGENPLDWPAVLAALAARSPEQTQATAAEPAAGPAGHQGIAPCVIPVAHSLDWQAFGVWLSALLAEHGEAIVRTKGVIPVRDWQHNTFHVLINGVQHVVYPPEHVVDPDRLPHDPALIFFLRGIAPERVTTSLDRFLNRFAESPES